MSEQTVCNGECEMNGLNPSEHVFVEELKKKTTAMMNEEVLDQETTRDVERVVIMRVSTKHINLWIRQLEMKRKEIGELAGMLRLDDVKNEIEKEQSLEKWAKRCTNRFTRKAKRSLFEEIDNFVWSGKEGVIMEWCKRNKVYDEITEDEIEEIWHRETPDDDETIRLNGKYV